MTRRVRYDWISGKDSSRIAGLKEELGAKFPAASLFDAVGLLLLGAADGTPGAASAAGTGAASAARTSGASVSPIVLPDITALAEPDITQLDLSSFRAKVVRNTVPFAMPSKPVNLGLRGIGM